MAKERNSNIELLRNLAMFLVLVVHSMYFALGAPTAEYLEQNPLDGKTQIVLELLAIACVNLFILISGWFGIRPKVKSVLTLLFQCFFLYILVYVFSLIIGISELSVRGIKQCFGLVDLAWFVPAYLGLYMLAPILNGFIESANKKTFETMLISYFAFELFFGWYLNTPRLFDRGYSTMSFIGLYMLARYIRLYSPKFSTLDKYIDLGIYFGITIFMVQFLIYTNNFDATSSYLYYCAPNVILASLFLFLFFTKISFQNRFINWCGASAFAVYLIHTNPNLVLHFIGFIKNLHENYGYFAFYTLNFLFLIAVFLGSVYVDKLRIYVWDKILISVENFKAKKETNTVN
ncbi:MAG: acyltransferase family protein [Campylobacteraceae bacterium]|nr:acyltransferase family protein [Campylobacteraceae bacterium]